jgi:beta-glucosidase-like glycosyl hydrolase
MMAILKTYGLEKATLIALQGEVDVVTINWDLKNVKRAINYIENSIKNKELSEKLIDEKLFRILKVKMNFLYDKKEVKRINKKQAENFLIELYKRGTRSQNIKDGELKDKVIYSNIKTFKNNEKINYLKSIPQNINNSVIIISKLSSIKRELLKNNIIIYLGADININKSYKIVVLNEDNKYTRTLALEMLK